jgi:tRNA(Ile)-lysidine synthase
MASTRNSNPCADLAARVSACLERFVRRHDRVVVALSGGIDSVCLLHVLRGLSAGHGFKLSALHVHHGISPNAGRWQAFCQRLCDTWEVPLDVKRAQVDIVAGGVGPEASARNARYRVFAETEAEWLALAHHLDDQAETFLLNVLRGAGVGGAAAMPRARTLHGRFNPGILRPFLESSRTEIESYARAAGLSWIEDESNSDTRLTRNFLRLNVLPRLRERFPGCNAVLARAASHFAESERLLRELARIDMATIAPAGRIIASRLALLDEARARNVLRWALRQANVEQPDTAMLRELLRQICTASHHKQLKFALGDKTLYRYKGEIWIVQEAEPAARVAWQGESQLMWGDILLRFERVVGAGISQEKMRGMVATIAPRCGGEHIQPDCRRPRRKLKKLLQEKGVPTWERNRLPLLWCGRELVWVPGIGIDCAWQCTPGAPGILPQVVSDRTTA